MQHKSRRISPMKIPWRRFSLKEAQKDFKVPLNSPVWIWKHTLYAAAVAAPDVITGIENRSQAKLSTITSKSLDRKRQKGFWLSNSFCSIRNASYFFDESKDSISYFIAKENRKSGEYVYFVAWISKKTVKQIKLRTKPKFVLYRQIVIALLGEIFYN